MEKRSDKFTDIFIDFDKIEELVDQMMERLEKNGRLETNKPIDMAFRITVDPNGHTKFDELASDPQVLEAQAEPLIEIQNQENAFLVTVELPGATKESIRLHAGENELTVSTQTAGKNFYKKIRFQETIKPGSAKAEFNNGILEIKIEKQQAIAGKKIPL